MFKILQVFDVCILTNSEDGRSFFWNMYYFMALYHEDWELQNSRIWLAKIDIDCGLDFPI